MTTQTSTTDTPAAATTEDTKPLVPGANLLGAPGAAGSCCGGSACGV
ncbi:hypothetical protein [Microbacterium invictum]|uniref:Uncharacterized protein n=1 Tax=Microbacterium invictum TaxID=515415 RepID=A0ABZ0VDS1_9MICO|nr:hypothetical protein [Microbacterium invictum]WQB71770.1 hypothetical protein T9R20_07410 [Microbacterium invictum]